MSESMGDFWIRKIGDFREGRIKACPVCERAPAPATPAATPLAALPAKWRKECPHGAIGPYSQGLMDCAEELETALAAAAQPQRESEQPEHD